MLAYLYLKVLCNTWYYKIDIFAEMELDKGQNKDSYLQPFDLKCMSKI